MALSLTGVSPQWGLGHKPYQLQETWETERESPSTVGFSVVPASIAQLSVALVPVLKVHGQKLPLIMKSRR